MYAKLKGIIDEIAADHMILDVQGVGFHIYCVPRALYAVGDVGEGAILYIDTHVREDSITLYGFLDKHEKLWFQTLMSVQGVGARAALAVLNVLPPDDLMLAITSEDKAMITRADGVGPKLATRIISELKDKTAKIQVTEISQSPGNPGNKKESTQPPETQGADGALLQDAVSALVNLGYGRSEAFQTIHKVLKSAHANDDNKNIDLQDIIRLALKELSA